MRILHVIPQFPFFGGRTIVGGHASSLLTLALVQAAAGDDVSILSYVQDREGEIPVEQRLRVHSLFDRARPGGMKFGLRFLRRGVKWARARRDQFDVVHCHSGFIDYLVVSSRLKRSLKLPTLHTLYCPIQSTGGRWRLPLVHGMIKRSGAQLDSLVAISRNVADSMRDYGPGDAHLIAPPVDTERFHPANGASDVRQELGLDADDVALLFVGNAKPQKNLSGVLAAFHDVRRDHANAKLVLTMELEQSSPDRRLAEIRQEIDDLGLASCTVQKGIVDDMPRLMQACDLVVAPFLGTFGPSDYFMVVLEAMACGKPAVVSAVGGMPEVISDDRGRLVDPRARGQLVEALQFFISDGGRRRTAGALAREFAEEHFDAHHIADRYRDLYKGIGF
jgi:glycosyltransferase involved in cell wall biosynthesis